MLRVICVWALIPRTPIATPIQLPWYQDLAERGHYIGNMGVMIAVQLIIVVFPQTINKILLWC